MDTERGGVQGIIILLNCDACRRQHLKLYSLLTLVAVIAASVFLHLLAGIDRLCSGSSLL